MAVSIRRGMILCLFVSIFVFHNISPKLHLRLNYTQMPYYGVQFGTGFAIMRELCSMANINVRMSFLLQQESRDRNVDSGFLRPCSGQASPERHSGRAVMLFLRSN